MLLRWLALLYCLYFLGRCLTPFFLAVIHYKK